METEIKLPFIKRQDNRKLFEQWPGTCDRCGETRFDTITSTINFYRNYSPFFNRLDLLEREEVDKLVTLFKEEERRLEKDRYYAPTWGGFDKLVLYAFIERGYTYYDD